MPPASAASTGVPGGDAIDLKVCMNLLKKTVVLFPLIVMVVIVWVRVTLTYENYDDGSGNSTVVLDAAEGSNTTIEAGSSILATALMGKQPDDVT
jgi:hypothetical protein